MLRTLKINPGSHLAGTLRVASDKSISHRAIMLGAIAQGTTELYNFLEGADSLATLAAFRAMGVKISSPQNGYVVIEGVGLTGLSAPQQPLDVGNAGTAMRLLAGLLAAQSFDSQLIGDSSLSKRPMHRVIEPLTRMGAKIKAQQNDFPPLFIQGGQALRAITYSLPMPSAQVKSCLLLAGLYAAGTTRIIEPVITRDHSERMLEAFGVPIKVEDKTISLEAVSSLQAQTLHIPADISSAAFFIVGASIAENSDILLTDIGINPTRRGVIDILMAMGADITLQNQREFGKEPVADIRVRSAPLKAITVPKEWVSLAIDEFPAIFIAAACATGTTVLEEAAELRVKESDRIAVMAEGLQQLGIRAQPTADGMRIEGGQLQGGHIQSQGDHRIAMAFAMAGLRASAPIIIEDCHNILTSFPNFIALAQQAGLKVEMLS